MPAEQRELFSIAEINSVTQYDNFIASAELVITMRYHGVVCSAKNSVPFLALSYENKMHEVANYVNCSESCIDVKNLIKDDELFYRKLNEIYDVKYDIINKLNLFMEDYKKN